MKENVLLQVHQLSKSFGGVHAIQGVSFHVHAREIVAVIGPNGAGKTTLFNVITGILRPTSGSIVFKGVSVVGKKPFQLAQLGMTRTFQNLQVFGNMTVIENVMVGLHTRLKTGIFSAGFRLPRVSKEEKQALEQAFACLRQVGIEHLAFEKADILPYGMQRLVELARAAASNPSLILLDEPMAGLNPQESNLLIEQNVRAALQIADYACVLDRGEIVIQGKADELLRDERVKNAYLGIQRKTLENTKHR